MKMVHKTTLKAYRLDGINEYFDLIISSKHNGQIAQMFRLMRKLNKAQSIEFVDYVLEREPKRTWKEWITDIFETKL